MAPAVIVGVVVVLTTETSGHLTVIVIGPELLLLALLSPSAVIVAVFTIVTPAGQRLVLVCVLSVMVLLVPEAIVPKVHVSVVLPAIGPGGGGEQLPASAPPRVQLNPAGRTSVSVTFVELASPPAVTVMA